MQSYRGLTARTACLLSDTKRGVLASGRQPWLKYPNLLQAQEGQRYDHSGFPASNRLTETLFLPGICTAGSSPPKIVLKQSLSKQEETFNLQTCVPHGDGIHDALEIKQNVTQANGKSSVSDVKQRAQGRERDNFCIRDTTPRRGGGGGGGGIEAGSKGFFQLVYHHRTRTWLH